AGGYFAVDFHQVRALYSVRAIAADAFQSADTKTTLSLYDTNYNLVYTQHLAGSSTVFDLPLPAPVFARFVRIGLEFNESKSAIGFKEIQAFGRPTNEVGVLSLTATSTQIVSGASTTLNWQEAELYRLDLYPKIGSVGSNTLASGLGSRG